MPLNVTELHLHELGKYGNNSFESWISFAKTNVHIRRFKLRNISFHTQKQADDLSAVFREFHNLEELVFVNCFHRDDQESQI